MKLKDGQTISMVLMVTLNFVITIHSQPESKDKDGESQCASSRVHVVGDNNEDFYVTDPSANCSFFIKEGDMTYIAVPEKNDSVSSRHKRNARRHPMYRWLNATVPYVISSEYNEYERNVILKAMNHWEVNTCIRFIPRTNELDYIVILKGFGCYSFVGRQSSSNQPQGVSLGYGCTEVYIAVHELGHVIGFYHEQSRPDRDEYVDIVYDNIFYPEFLGINFRKQNHSDVNLYGLGYDYASIMHYRRDAFSKNGNDTIEAKDPTIPFGEARELSPLDIAKANAHYNCGPKNSHPPIQTVVPALTLTLPPNITCGEVIKASNGTIRSPGYPNHRHNQDCAWVIQIPEGYSNSLWISFPNFQLEESPACSKDYIQIYQGTSLSPSNLIFSKDSNDGRICKRTIYSLLVRPKRFGPHVITVYYHTDGNNTVSDARGLEVMFVVPDINECILDSNRCHSCRNTPGSYECTCRNGYYPSVAAQTCFDINECAYDNGGCQHKCINKGGSYECKCEAGFILQNDNRSCGQTRPTTPPSITNPPTPPTTIPPQQKCGRNMTESTGSLWSPNWPETYPVNIDCEWFIDVAADKVIQISFEGDPFGIAGSLPQCEKDYLLVYDGHSDQDTSFGPFCHFTVPDDIITTTNLVKVVFHAGPAHSTFMKGFKANYIAVDAPVVTTMPPTTRPPPPTTEPPTSPKCGRNLNEPSGSFTSPNWPRTYPVNVDCEWIITCDQNEVVEIKFKRGFGIAGNLPDCEKDWVKVVHGLHLGATESGPFCHYTNPGTITTSSSKAKVVLHAGPAHSPSRLGFAASYQCVDNPNPPTVIPPTQTTVPTTSTPSISLPTSFPPPAGTISSCGGFIRHGTHFASPGYHGLPGKLQSGSYCRWNVIGGAAGGHRYTFTVKYLHLPSCSVGSLVVTDRLRGNHQTTLCGSSTEIPYEYHTTNNVFRVELRVNDVQSFGGFLAILK